MTSLTIIGDNEEQPLAHALDNGVALVLRENLTKDEWLEVGSRLGRGAQGIQWFIGDWINYGVDRGYVPRDKYDVAVELTGMSKDWLYQCAWVSRSIAPEDRRAELSFTHHRQVASLRPGIERAAILKVAAETGMTTREVYDLSTEVMAPTEPETEDDSEIEEEIDFEETEVSRAPAVASTPPVQREVIELGPHRLLVGDSQDPETWKKLFAGQPMANAMWTDPPYGVNYTGKSFADGSEQMQIDSDNVADLPRLLALSFAHADQHLIDGSSVYICTGFRNHHISMNVIEALGWRFSTELVWIKNHFAMGRGYYHPQHESQLFAFKGDGSRWYGPKNRSTVFGLGDTAQGFGYTIPRPNSAHDHPTMKPPKLIFEQLRNSVLTGDVVVDPFAGSGSTMMAAEQLGVRAFMVELNPRYAARIVERWQQLNASS